MRVEKAPAGRGSGEQWVRERFPKELQELRRRHVSTVMVVMLDGDRFTVDERLSALDSSCTRAEIPTRSTTDRVAVFVPNRNIETWIEYLAGNDVNEEEPYPKLARERECAEHVRKLREMCDNGNLRRPVPPSLESACTEYRALVATAGG